MKSPVRPPALHPLTVKRARWLHHFQAWSPKLKRRISLFSRPSVSIWLLIEASPDIEQFCERPGHVQIDGQRVLADFWINRGKKHEYFVLQDMPKLTLLDDPGGLLDPLPIQHITPAWLLEHAQLIANWMRILPIVTSYAPMLSGEFVNQVLKRLRGPERLVDIERRFLPDDPLRTRAAIFELLRCGHVRADELTSRALSGATRFTNVI